MSFELQGDGVTMPIRFVVVVAFMIGVMTGFYFAAVLS